MSPSVTFTKWMFTYPLILVIPFTYKEMLSIQNGSIGPKRWVECLFAALFGTYIAYMLMMTGHKNKQCFKIILQTHILCFAAFSVL